jgi:hypothetical protein
MIEATSVEVPADLSCIDADWLERALRYHGLDVHVTDVGVEQIAAGAGFIGLLARLTPTYATALAEAPTSLVVKIPSPDPGAQVIGQMLRLWERERLFYRELAPTVDVAVPCCYLAEEDPADKRVVLLLEDLGDLDQPDQLDGTTLDRATAAVDWLAAFHSQSWGKAEDPAYLPWIPRPDDAIYTGLQPMAAANLDLFTAAFEPFMTPTRLDVIRRAIDDLPALLARHETPYTVGHGDFRLDNMLFRPTGELVLLDWQLLLVGTYHYDLAYFLTTSLTTEQRRAWEHDLLRRYLDRIQANVETDLTMDDVIDGHRQLLRFLCAVLVVSGVTLDFEVNPRARALANALVERTMVAIDDHDVANTA